MGRKIHFGRSESAVWESEILEFSKFRVATWGNSLYIVEKAWINFRVDKGYCSNSSSTVSLSLSIIHRVVAIGPFPRRGLKKTAEAREFFC